MYKLIASKFLKEPLLHFFLLASLLLILDTRLNDDNADAVVVGDEQVDWLQAIWYQQWGREATDDELSTLIDEYIREELFVREAMALGLGDDDAIIRRRLVQKLGFIYSHVESPPENLIPFFEQHKEQFRVAPTLSFSNIYFSKDLRNSASKDAGRLLAKLQSKGADGAGFANENYESLGDPFRLASFYKPRDQHDIAQLMGAEFAEELFALESGHWLGPVQSVYGSHLIYLHSYRESYIPQFESVKEKVIEYWHEYQRERSEEKLFIQLSKKYPIEVIGGPGRVNHSAIRD